MAYAVGIGDPAPEFDLPPFAQKEERFNSIEYKGKIVLVNFWASWCKPCKEELPALEAVYQKYRDKGFEVVGINIDKEERNVRRFLSRNPISFKVLLDPESSVIAAYHARAMPSSFLIDRKGTIRWVKFGFSKSQITLFENEIQTLLEASANGDHR
jgi:peroxiredoxin